MLNGFAYNAGAFNGSGFTVADALTFSPDQPYIVQLRDASGNLVGKIDNWVAGDWQSTVNGVDRLTMRLPLDDPLVQAQSVSYPNQVWLYDSAFQPLQRFAISKVDYDWTASECAIEASSLLYLLDQEYLNLDTPIALDNVRKWVDSVMSSQDNANPISVGYIHPEIANKSAAFGLDFDKSILEALQNLRKSVGGIISIDAYGRLKWDTDSTGYAEHGITLYDDIETYRERIDTDTVINRLYVEGKIYAASATSHIRQTIPGGYVEDTTSQATYGIRPQRITINAANATELLEQANKVLAYLKDPQIVREISAIDLSRVQLDPDNPTVPHTEYIYPGANIFVTPPNKIPGASAFKTRILSVRRNLSNFAAVSITVGQVDPRRSSSSGSTGSTSEFFDLLDDTSDEVEEWVETLIEQDVDIWEALDQLQTDFDEQVAEDDVNEIQPVGEENALGENTKFAPSDHVHRGVILVYDSEHTQQSDLGIPDGLAVGYINDGNDDYGVWYFPADGSTNDDWVKLYPDLEYDSSWTQQADLGNPGRYRIGYIPSGNDDSGFWIFPPDGSSNSDWIPLPSYG